MKIKDLLLFFTILLLLLSKPTPLDFNISTFIWVSISAITFVILFWRIVDFLNYYGDDITELLNKKVSFKKIKNYDKKNKKL